MTRYDPNLKSDPIAEDLAIGAAQTRAVELSTRAVSKTRIGMAQMFNPDDCHSAISEWHRA
jgi:hypothetical protein